MRHLRPVRQDAHLRRRSAADSTGQRDRTLTAALGDARNWQGQLADADRRMVTLREPADQSAIPLHPLGTLSVNQTVVPLDLEIAKFGNATPADAHAVFDRQRR